MFSILILDAKKFEQWLESVCQRLPPKSVIIMDNASYHSKMVTLRNLPFCCDNLFYQFYHCREMIYHEKIIKTGGNPNLQIGLLKRKLLKKAKIIQWKRCGKWLIHYWKTRTSTLQNELCKNMALNVLGCHLTIQNLTPCKHENLGFWNFYQYMHIHLPWFLCLHWVKVQTEV